MVSNVRGGKSVRKAGMEFIKVPAYVVDVGIVESKLKKSKGKKVELALILAMSEQDKKLPVNTSKNKIPRRATLRPAIEQAKYAPRVRSFAGNVMAGNGIRLGLEKIGETAELKAKSNMQALKTPKLKEATVRNRVRKGTTNPLVDTGELKGNLSSKVNKK